MTKFKVGDEVVIRSESDNLRDDIPNIGIVKEVYTELCPSIIVTFGDIEWGVLEDDLILIRRPVPKTKYYRRKWLNYGDYVNTEADYYQSKELFDSMYYDADTRSDEWEEIEI